MIGAGIATDYTFLETLDIEHCETFPPEFDSSLPPDLVAESWSRSIVVSLVMLAVYEVGITFLCEIRKKLDTVAYLLPQLR